AIVAYAQAAVTSANRAQGAKDAGDLIWQTQQTQAAQLYSANIGLLLNKETTLLQSLKTALAAAGLSITVTQQDVVNFQNTIAVGGLPPGYVQVLQLLGADPTAISQVASFLVGLDGNSAVGQFPDSLVSAARLSAIQAAGAGLSGSALLIDHPINP